MPVPTADDPLVQHRVSSHVAVEEKPDVLWDRPDLERLYARQGGQWKFLSHRTVKGPVREEDGVEN